MRELSVTMFLLTSLNPFVVIFLLGLGKVAWTTVITVDNPVDSAGNATFCHPPTVGLCNFRSAWSACAKSFSNSSENCDINLPQGQLYFDPAKYGNLTISSPMNITVYGQNTQLIFSPSVGLSHMKPKSAKKPAIHELHSQSYYYYYYYDFYSYYYYYYYSNTNYDDDNGYYYYSAPPDIGSTPLFSYQQKPITTAPTVSFFNVSFFNFTSTGDAAILESQGNIHLHFDYTTFSYNVGDKANCLYILGNYLGKMIIRNSFFINNRNLEAYTSAIGTISVKDSNNIVIVNTRFENNKGDTGGLTFTNTNNIQFDTVSLLGNIGDMGVGGIEIDTCSHLYFQHIIVQDCLATSFYSTGGASMHITESKNVTILDSSFANGVIDHGYGGCVFIEKDNHHIHITNSQFMNCTVAGYGGALGILSSNAHISLSNLSFVNNIVTEYKSVGYGGSIYIGNSNNHTTLDHIWIYNSTAENGGGIYISQMNRHMSLSNITISYAYAWYSGGGMLIYDSNKYLTLNKVMIERCIASTGGGIQFQSNNQEVTLQHVTIRNTTAYMNTDMSSSSSSSKTINSGSGGGLYFGQQNMNIQLIECHIVHTNADVAGGGVYLDNGNTNIVFLRGDVHACRTSGNGGGVYTATNNQGIIFAGLKLTFNQAMLSGGAIYNQLNNPLMMFLDVTAYQQTKIAESSHPYESRAPMPGGGSAQPISFKYLTFPKPITVMIIFDAQTNIRSLTDVITVHKQNKQIVFQSTTDTTFPGVSLPILIVKDCTYIDIDFYGPSTTTNAPTSTSMNYYGFKAYMIPIYTNPTYPMIMNNNHATYGGALYSFNNLAFPLFANVQVLSNMATIDGGAMYFRVSNYGVTMESCLFANNFCTAHGGAIYFSTANYGALLSDCQFVNNTAKNGFGGGLAMLNENGVGVFSSGNGMNMSECIFSQNIASTGGGIYAESANVFSVSKTSFIANHANTSSGGGMALQVSNIVLLSNNLFTANVAYTLGGGLSILGNSIVSLSGNSTFRSNQALVGGAIAVSKAPLWYTPSKKTMTMIVGNIAGRGSALFFYQVIPSTNKLQYMTIQSNVATVGGTVYWIKDAVMTTEPAGINSNTTKWMSNTAPYGVYTATQGVQLTGPSVYSVNVYNQPLFPYMTLHLLDAYHQLIPLNSPTTTVVVSIPDTFISKAHCFSSYPFISGENTIGLGVTIANGGYAVFNNLQVFCAPLGNVTIQYQAKLADLVPLLSTAQIEPYFLTTETFLTFRSCLVGEYESGNTCIECPTGSFTLTNNSQSCVDCSQTTGVSHCATNQIVLQSGYWRRYATTQAVMKCPSGSKSCLGGNITGNALCVLGYEGPLCNVCSDGYYKADSTTCSECSGSGLFSPTLITVIVLVFVGGTLLWMTYLYNTALFVVDANAITTTNSMYGQMISLCYTLYDFWKTQSKSILLRVKVIVSTFQVVTVTATVFAVTIPDNLTNFLDAFKFFNLRFSTIIPVGCTTANFDFIENLIITTLFPIGLCLGLYLTMFVEYTITKYLSIRRQEVLDEQVLFAIVQNKYFNYIVYVTYLVLPSVTTTIFQMFICTNIDPEHETDDDSLYLTADMSISCTSMYYYQGVFYAVMMILIYPIGIPCLYLKLLYENREEIMDRNLPPIALDENKSHQPSKNNQKNKGFEEEEEENAVELTTFKKYDHTTITSSTMTTQSESTSSQHEKALNRIQEEEINNPMHPSSTSTTSAMTLNEINEQPSPRTATPTIDLKVLTMTTPSGRVLSSSSTRIAFLWSAYEPKYWYWEIVDTTRRLLLTAVLSVITPGTSGQNVFSMLLALAYIKLYTFYSPYEKRATDILAEVGQYQIFFTFFGAMIFQNELLDKNVLDLIGASLILINMSVVIVTIRFQLIDYLDIRKKAGLSTELGWTMLLGFFSVPLPMSGARGPVLSTAPMPVPMTVSAVNIADTSQSSSLHPVQAQPVEAQEEEDEETNKEEMYEKV